MDFAMEFLKEVIMPALAIIVTGLATWGMTALVNWLNSKTKNERVKTAVNNTLEIITAAVAETSQIFVDDLKKTGSFSETMKAEAFKMTLNRVKSQLTDEAAQLIQTTTSDFDAWISAEIEKAVAENKKNAKGD